jgi:hypothetical protein
MLRIPFLRTHSRYREMADAFIDGELRERDLARFEAHSAACAECMALLATGRTLKQSLRQVPEVQAPRSFRITPALLQQAAPKPAPMRATPVLMVARIGAAASVAAFAVVGTLQFSSTTGGDGSTAASPMFELSAAGGMADDLDTANDTQSDQPGGEDKLPEATPQLAPPPSAQVAGAGSEDATPEPAPDSLTNPAEGPPDDGQRSTLGEATDVYSGDGVGTTAFAPVDDSGASYGPWLVVLGGATIVALSTLGTLEYRRRQI